MPLNESELQAADERLGALSPALPAAFRESIAALPPLSDEDLRLIFDEGLALAGQAVRSWEACPEFFAAAPAVLESAGASGLRSWSATGRALSEQASSIAGAYFRATPEVLPLLAGGQVQDWAALGERLFKSTWKSVALAGDFFTVSPAILATVSLADLARLARVLEAISERSADLAAACLQAAPAVVESLEHTELIAFLDFAAAISETTWPEAAFYFQRGPDSLRAVEASQRARYLQLATRVARSLGRQSYVLFSEGTASFREINPAMHGRVIELAARIVDVSAPAAMAFVRIAPTLAERLRPEELQAWHAAGLDILRLSVDGGEAYFSLESARAEQMLLDLSARIDLQGVSDLLRMYGKALTGANVSILPASALTEKEIGWVNESGPSTEGTAVYLPEHMDLYRSKAENFAVLKVYATHQTAHIEFESFAFSFRRAGKLLPRTRHLRERERRSAGLVTRRSWVTDMERFFDLFDDRRLAGDIFTIVEDLRIDSRVREEYSGIRRPARGVQEEELKRRPEPRSLPLRMALVENLIRASLDGEDTIVWPKGLEAILVRAVRALNQVRPVEASVEDAAETALQLYDIAAAVPNLPPEMMDVFDWDEITEDLLDRISTDFEEAPPEDDELAQLPSGTEMPYESPEQVDFRGDFKPELVQLLMRLRNPEEEEMLDENELSQLTADEIQELLEKSVEIETPDEFDMDAMSAFLQNLEKETTGSESDESVENMQVLGEAPSPGPQPEEVRVYHYDEWDFRASDYRPRWCTVNERTIDEGTEDFYEKTLRSHASLIAETQRQFELLKPETFRKLKRLEDGEDVDLDHAIEFLVQKRAGHGDVQKIFWRRNKIERAVAVAFLLDMSASTDEEIEKRRPPAGMTGDPRRYAQWATASRPDPLQEPPKRIIDLEKESLVLLTRALEVIHDSYGIYGFSGYGRENVEYFVIKDLEEPFDETIRRRIERVSPIRSTRMGPAIRHTTFKLMQSDAKVKILFLVSDGRPQDHGYGRDRTEKEYAIHDTHKALLEAKHKGITPFALTVDKGGHDYLGQMCEDMAYEVLADINLLPSRLPTLYRRLTE